MKSDFNKSVLTAKSMIKYIDIYKSYNPDIVLLLRYEEIIKNPTQAVNKILHFVNLKKIKIFNQIFYIFIFLYNK